MARRKKPGSRWSPFQPFLETGRGQVFGLASPRDQVRDGLAFVQIARQFPEPRYEGIVFEPGCRSIQPAENVMIVGNALLFAPPGTQVPKDEAMHVPVVAALLADRLCRIEAECCFRFEGTKERRCLANSVTGMRYESRVDRRKRVVEDYGVIRCVFRSNVENTVTFEGNHRLATMGVTKVATDDLLLEAVRDAIEEIPQFDETLPLEILVHAKFDDVTGEGVYTMRDVNAVPVLAVYNRRWVHGLSPTDRWRDQLPWDVVRCAAKEARAVDLASAADAPLPRVEIEADLRGANGVREVARELLAATTHGTNGSGPPPPSSREDRLLGELMDAIEHFRIELVQEGPAGRGEKRTEMPTGQLTRIRTIRKQFFVQLALLRLLGRVFHRSEETVRTQFPMFGSDLADDVYLKRFVGSVPGRMREGFLPLFGEAARPRDHLQLDFDRKAETYTIRLGTVALVLKVRL
ncbi:hypothetical protein K8I85_15320 [bacterium]|nr:hypothetical protein [bacterium]